MSDEELSTSCFEVAISIARQREQADLLQTLLKFLQEHLPLHDSLLYDIVGKDPVVFRQHGNDERSTINDDALLEACYRSQDTVSDDLTSEKKRYLFPVHGIGYIKHLIDIQGNELDQQEYQSLIQLLTLVSSQFMLLDKNNHDALTGLLNRRAFEERLAQLITLHTHRNHDQHHGYCFALLDIDHFKRVNDTYGHLYGDEVLILFAGIMEKVFRHEDMMFRYGGEEFAVVLNNVDVAMANNILNRFRERVAEFDFPQVGSVTVSIGYTAISHMPNTTEIIAQADKALYYSKENGRNQVHAYEALVEQGEIIVTTRDSDDIELF